MHVKVSDLMVPNVVVGSPRDKVCDIRDRMLADGIRAVPIVNEEAEPIGIVTAIDLIEDLPPKMPVSDIMAEKVYTVPLYSDIHIAARIMLNHNLHHLVVTNEHKVVGIISSFDLLKLVEGHRFVMKGAPTESTKKGSHLK